MKKDKKHLRDYLNNWLVYSIAFIVSVVLIALGFVKEQSFADVCLYIGTSGIGAVALACFIEFSNNKHDERNIKEHRKELFGYARSSFCLSIERLFWAYNRIETEFLNKRSDKETYKMSLRAFVDHLDAFADSLGEIHIQQSDSGVKKGIFQTLDDVKHRICMFQNEISVISKTYRLIEKSEFFSKKETDDLNTICSQLDEFDVNFVLKSVDSECFWTRNLFCIKEAFARLLEFDEFSDLKKEMLFYKDKTISFKYLYADSISNVDKENAIELPV